MEYYQAIQNRAGETVAVVNENLPGLKVGTALGADLLARSQALAPLAQTRDDRLADLDAAVNAENQGFLLIRRLTLALPDAARGTWTIPGRTRAPYSTCSTRLSPSSRARRSWPWPAARGWSAR